MYDINTSIQEYQMMLSILLIMLVHPLDTQVIYHMHIGASYIMTSPHTLRHAK
jgi:hypothetical protein